MHVSDQTSIEIPLSIFAPDDEISAQKISLRGNYIGKEWRGNKHGIVEEVAK